MTQQTNSSPAKNEQHTPSEPPALSPLYFLVSGLVGAIVATSIVLYGASSTAESVQFVQKPEFLAWLFLLNVQAILWSVTVVPLIRSFRSFRLFQSNTGRCLLEGFIITLATISVYYFAQYIIGIFRLPPFPLFHHVFKMGVLFLFGGIVALLATAGIRHVHVASNFILNGIAPTTDNVIQYLWLRTRLRWYLFILVGVIGLSTLMTGTLRNAVIASAPTLVDSLPPIFTLLFGGYYSVVVALVYLPVRILLDNVGRQLHALFFAIDIPTDENWKKWYDNQRAFGDFLQLNAQPIDNLETGFMILAPLLGSILAVFFGN